MKVFVAQRIYDYEGFAIIGIFRTKKKAEQACENDKWDDGRVRGDGHEVAEFELNEIAD